MVGFIRREMPMTEHVDELEQVALELQNEAEKEF